MAEVKNKEEKNTQKASDKGMIGEVKIADEVVAMIAGLAATEVSGVDSMAGNITNELVGKLGMKNLSKGVKVDVTEEHVSVDLSLNIKYGYNIPEVSEKVQEKVKSAIENMTGLEVSDVNIRGKSGRRKIKLFLHSPFPAMIHKALKKPLLDGSVESHVLRMPLDSQAERIILYLQSLREAFRAVSGDPQSFSYSICRLMMKAVYGHRICHEKPDAENQNGDIPAGILDPGAMYRQRLY